MKASLSVSVFCALVLVQAAHAEWPIWGRDTIEIKEMSYPKLLAEGAREEFMTAFSCGGGAVTVGLTALANTIPAVSSLPKEFTEDLREKYYGHDRLAEVMGMNFGFLAPVADLVLMAGDYVQDGAIDDHGAGRHYHGEWYSKPFEMTRTLYRPTAAAAKGLFDKDSACAEHGARYGFIKKEKESRESLKTQEVASFLKASFRKLSFRKEKQLPESVGRGASPAQGATSAAPR